MGHLHTRGSIIDIPRNSKRFLPDGESFDRLHRWLEKYASGKQVSAILNGKLVVGYWQHRPASEGRSEAILLHAPEEITALALRSTWAETNGLSSKIDTIFIETPPGGASWARTSGASSQY